MFAHSLGSVMCYDLMYETCTINGLLETKERDSSPMDVDLTGGEREREEKCHKFRKKGERERERGYRWSLEVEDYKNYQLSFSPQIIHLKTRLMKSLKSYRS